MFLRINLRVAQPRNIKVVVALLDRFPRETTPATFLALILAFGSAIRIVAVGLLELREVLAPLADEFCRTQGRLRACHRTIRL
jgi:hypothetical protein